MFWLWLQTTAWLSFVQLYDYFYTSDVLGAILCTLCLRCRMYLWHCTSTSAQMMTFHFPYVYANYGISLYLCASDDVSLYLRAKDDVSSYSCANNDVSYISQNDDVSLYLGANNDVSHISQMMIYHCIISAQIMVYHSIRESHQHFKGV